MSTRCFFAALSVLAAVTSSSRAFADDGDWGLPPRTVPGTSPAATLPPAVTPVREKQAKVARSEEEAASAAAEPPCAVNVREGFSDADVSAVEQVVCSEIREHGHPGRYRIHLGKLGGKVIVTLVECIEGANIERQVVLSDLGELTVAAPRLVEANHERKSVAETLDVSNVVGDEARTPKKRYAAVHAWLGIIGAGGPGGTGGGVNLAISAGSDRWSFVGDLRLAGEAFSKPAWIAGTIVTLGGIGEHNESEFSFASATAGARYHILLSDFSPFLGAGLGVDYLARGQNIVNEDRGTTGLAGYGELGFDFLRTHMVGGAVALRADMPAFATAETKADPTDSQHYLKRSLYAPVFSAGFAFRF